MTRPPRPAPRHRPAKPRRRSGWWLLTGTLLFAGCAGRDPARTATADTPTFNRDIQPILSEHCYHCHGPDSGSREGGLRLDLADQAHGAGESGKTALVPGNASASEVMRRILSTDPLERMPPPRAHSTLDATEVALLRAWIDAGAVYEPHWAFIAPVRPEPPAVTQVDWPQNAIDHFILARLETEDLAPEPAADKAALLRRVTYDLTGLPPTPDEVAAFLADDRPDAYARVVDRLLASPRYGEHRAHYWLDVARYGDSHGLHRDAQLDAWPYRDFVIRAFNTNKPFDQFTRENLAGDLLPARTLDQQLGSAFLRLGISSGEAGSIGQELRVNNARERTEAFGAAYLGLTTGCAACHDHKFDPLSQKDHYQLSAFFNNLTENPNNQARGDWPPSIRLPAPADVPAYNRLLDQQAGLRQQLADRRADAPALLAAWLADPDSAPRPVDPAGLRVRLKFDEIGAATFANTAPGARPAIVTATGAPPVWGEDTWFWPGMRLDTTTRIALPAIGDVGAATPFSVGAWIRPSYDTSFPVRPPEHGTLFSRLATTAGHDGPGWAVDFIGDDKANKRGWLRFTLAGRDGAATIRTRDTLLGNEQWRHVLATYDGSGSAAGMALWVDGRRREVEVLADELAGDLHTTAPLQLGRREPDALPLRGTAYQDFRYYGRSLTAAEAARLPWEDPVAGISRRPVDAWNADERHTVERFFFEQRDPVSLALTDALVPLQVRLDALTRDGPTALVSEESPRLAYADVLDRGVYTQRRERVRPDVPHFLPALPAAAPRNRRGLADWVVSPANPLTARVTVNRMWAELFGTGLVATTEDFGIMGERPSHPGLLDWLAVDFVESGWDVKRCYRQMVLSATYRQSARISPAKLAHDPDNRLLARGPRFRMDGEMLRDTVLATSGLLVEQQGGPSVKPYQPSGIWEAGTPPKSNTARYEQDHGDALYRRSLYTFWKRMATMPNLNAFDAPNRDVACTRRQRTTTPLQALVTLNDVQWLEAARVLAENLVRAQPADAARLRHLGLTLLARDWHDEERAILDNLLGTLRAHYAQAPADAAELITVGEAPVDATLPPVEVAVWTVMASTAQNLDATLNK